MHAAVESLHGTAIHVRTVAHEPTGVRRHVPSPNVPIPMLTRRLPSIQSLTSLTWRSALVIPGGASPKSPAAVRTSFRRQTSALPSVLVALVEILRCGPRFSSGSEL